MKRTSLIIILLLLCLTTFNTCAVFIPDIEIQPDPNYVPVIVIPEPIPAPKPAPKPAPVPVVKPAAFTPKNYAKSVSVDAMYETIRVLSATPRVACSPEEQTAGEYLESKLIALGYDTQIQQVPAQFRNPDKTLGAACQSSNVFAVLNYNPSKKTILLIAHRDSVYVAGANDNASGSAMVVELAAYLASHPLKNYNTAVLITGSEEGQHAGAKAYVAAPFIPLSSTKLVLNFDMVGAGSTYELFAYTNKNLGSVYMSYALKVGKAFKLNIAKKQTKYSDHKEFEEKGVSAVTFMNLASYPYYHKPTDTLDRISKTTLRNISNIALNLIEEVDRN